VARQEFDIVLLTTSMQVVNLMKIAEEAGIGHLVLEGLRASRIGSIGPTTTETLEQYGLRADFEPSHPKMGLLVNEMAARNPAPGIVRGDVLSHES
jgi:uroporphyrinogen-III synthase